jgi:uroporphyrinogen decarboxylase
MNSQKRGSFMNSRERGLAALNRQKPDRIPIDFGGNQSSIHIIAYKRLLEYLHIEDPHITYADYVQQNVIPCDAILHRFEVDTRYIRTPKNIKSENFQPSVEGPWVGVTDQFGVFWGNSREIPAEKRLYYSPVIYPLEKIETIQGIHSYNWPDGKNPSNFEGLKETARNLHEKTHYLIATPTVGCIYEYCHFLFGFKSAMKHLRRNPQLIVATMQELLKYWSDFALTYLHEVGSNVDVLCVNGDLADQTGPLMNPALYRDLIKPIEGQFSALLHKTAPIKINYHCCGSTVEFLDHFADIGYDAYNPVQISAAGMDPAGLKARFGKRISFWGGLCDTQKVLSFGTPASVKAEVQRNLAAFSPSGGYIAANVHNITAEVPPENIVAMFDSLLEFNKGITERRNKLFTQIC